MPRRILIDTGLLVAILDKSDRFHNWATQTVANLPSPFLTCEPVITEACFLLKNVYGGEDAVMGLVSSGNIQISFYMNEEINPIRKLMQQYQNVPMSLADGCLVRMSKLIAGSSILTLDSDFRVYRKHKNEIIDLIIPDVI